MNTNHFLRAPVALAGLGLAVTLLAGCSSPPLRPDNADGSHCHRTGRGLHLQTTCTTGPVPDASAAAAARRLDTTPDALTLYVLRQHWADSHGQLELRVDGMLVATTIPASLVRLRLKPGTHRISARGPAGQVAELDIQGAAGELQTLQLRASTWAWGTTLAWDTRLDAATLRARAPQVQLIADLDTRR